MLVESKKAFDVFSLGSSNLRNNWKVTLLGEVVKFIGGSQPDKSLFKYQEHPEYVRLVQIRDFKSDDNPTYIPRNSTKKFFSSDDVMIGRYGPPVFQILRGLSGAYNVALIKAQPSEFINRNYLYYLLKSKPIQDLIIHNSQRTAGQTGVNLDLLNKVLIPLPPLETQIKIANALDKADSIRQKDKQIILKYDELLQSVFLEMFGDPVRNEMGWELAKVIDYCECIVPGRDKPKSFTGHIPWVTTEDLNHLGQTAYSKKAFGLTQEEINTVRAKVIPKGAVVITCVGDLGIASIAGEDFVMNQQLHAFICGPEIINYFLMFVLTYQTGYMYSMATSTTVPYMNKTVCNSIPIIVPPKNLQLKFAELVIKIESQKSLAQQSLRKSEELFNSILQKAFKGELFPEPVYA